MILHSLLKTHSIEIKLKLYITEAYNYEINL